MLWLERQVVAALVGPAADDALRAAVEEYVDESLRSMPPHLRAGVAAESVVLGIVPRLRHALGRLDRAALTSSLERWARSPVDPVRQYPRLLHSLVLFAEQELAPGAAG